VPNSILRSHCIFRPTPLHSPCSMQVTMDEGNTFLIPSRIKLSGLCTTTSQPQPITEPWKLRLDFGNPSSLALPPCTPPAAFLPTSLPPRGLPAAPDSSRVRQEMCGQKTLLYQPCVCYICSG